MPTLSENRRARFDYEALETFEAGLVLAGYEVKAAKAGRAQIAGAHVMRRGTELFLENAAIAPYQPKNVPEGYNEKRARKLILSRKEIDFLIGKLREKGLTIIPLELYTKSALVKVKIALARPKKKGDKREAIIKKTVERDIRRGIR